MITLALVLGALEARIPKDAWRNATLGDKAYYVTILRNGGLRWRRNHILANLRRTHEVTLVGTNGMAEVYAITPKATQ